MINKKEMNALILFAREPQLGAVKTRLEEKLPARDVLQLYKAFLQDVIAMAKKVRCHKKMIYYDSKKRTIPFLSQFSNEFELIRQEGGDLGLRMHHAFSDCIHSGVKKVVIIGTDCLSISSAEVEQAFLSLDLYDCVFGPCRDGGYYLVGLKKPSKAIFTHIEWGGSDVLNETLKHSLKHKKSAYLLKRKRDIDTYSDLKIFNKSSVNLSMTSHTRKVLKQLNF